MIDAYLTETATVKRVIGLNDYGEPITETEEIKTLWNGGQKLVRNAQGHEVVSVARALCAVPVKTGDILEREGREWPVIAARPRSLFDGTGRHWEAAI